MTPEQFHDALNYLDDDLIAQTDELRQGRRVLQHRIFPRQVLGWVAAAACLVLALGLGSRLMPTLETGDAIQLDGNGSYGSNGKPEQSPDGWITADHDVVRQESLSCVWVQVTLGELSLSVPENWTCQKEWSGTGTEWLVLRPPYEEGAVRVGYDPAFGVCGTGLTTETRIIAGMDASVGTYDGSHVWSFLTFSGAGEGYVVVNEGDAWWGVYGGTLMEILETIEIKGD